MHVKHFLFVCLFVEPCLHHSCMFSAEIIQVIVDLDFFQIHLRVRELGEELV